MNDFRADRAEAALATVFGDGLRTAICVIASIGYGKNEDVDAGHEEALRAVEKYLTDWTSRSQPHDRTALDRMLAEAREKALREAAQVLTDEIDLARIAMPQVVPILAADRKAILALIEKEKTE